MRDAFILNAKIKISSSTAYHLPRSVIRDSAYTFSCCGWEIAIDCYAIMYGFMQDAGTQVIFLVGEKWKCMDIQLPECVDADLEEPWQFWNSEEIKVRKILSV